MRTLLCIGLLVIPTFAQTRGDVRVKVEGPTGVPLPGIGIGRAAEEGAGKPFGWTNEKGELLVRDEPYDGSVFLTIQDKRLPGKLVITNEGMKPFRVQGGAVTGPELNIRAHDGVWCELEFRDAESGKKLDGIWWNFHERRDKPRVGNRRIVYGTWGLRLAKVPAGYSLDAENLSFWNRSLFAKGVRAVIPVHRAIDLKIALTRDGGKAAPRGWVGGLDYLLREWNVRGTVDAKGVIRVGPAPFFRDEPLTIYAFDEDEGGSGYAGEWKGRMPSRYRKFLSASVALKKADLDDDEFDSPGGNSAIGVAGGRASASGTGAVSVRVLRSNGEPAAGARIELIPPGKRRRVNYYLDDDGRAWIGGMLGGCRWKLRVHGPGLIDIRKEIDVAEKKTLQLTLREPVPGAVSVEVFDERGRPLPYAIVSTRKDGWIGSYTDIQDGVARIDRHTDRKGRRTLQHLPSGAMELRAYYGSRRGVTRCTIKAGETIQARIQLGAVPTK
ncbi:MAG: carboxypeptidase-like regulatory domain-containing protein [Planctomycetota bacterium]|jgi:hypothetical protein